MDSTGPGVLCEPEVTEVAPPDACGWVGTLTADVVEQCDPLGKMEVQAKQYPVGQTDVLFAAEAQAGNEAACTSVVTVLDETPPEVACNLASDQLSLTALPQTWAATATDGCPATVEVTDWACLAAGDDVTETCQANRVGPTFQVLSPGGQAASSRWTWRWWCPASAGS